jgi:hypothetical protein
MYSLNLFNIKRGSVILPLLIFTFMSFGCFFRTDREITAEADKAIYQSETLRNLEKLCNDLPVLGKLTPSRKSVGKQMNMVSYYYRIDRDFNDLKAIYKEKLSGEG